MTKKQYTQIEVIKALRDQMQESANNCNGNESAKSYFKGQVKAFEYVLSLLDSDEILKGYAKRYGIK